MSRKERRTSEKVDKVARTCQGGLPQKRTLRKSTSSCALVGLFLTKLDDWFNFSVDTNIYVYFKIRW